MPNNHELTAFDGAPYMQLWLAVLRQAVDDATMVDALGPEAADYRVRALTWLHADLVSVGSLQWICDCLGIDPERVRTEVRRRRRDGGQKHRQRVANS